MNEVDLFYQMLRIRRIEDAIGDRYSEQKIRCPIHLSNGQEGIAVGVAAVLQEEDEIICSHRSHAHYLAKGSDLKKMIAELHGKETGCAQGRGGSIHLIDRSVGMMGSTPILGNTIPIGVGLALAAQMKGEKRVVAIFFGDGATEEGTFGECLNFASLKNLPILFICENNLYSTCASLDKRQPSSRSREKIATANGIFAKTGDGNDVTKCLKLAQEGIDTIKRGEGPAFIEFETYRFKQHCGPNIDLDSGYRLEQEYHAWLEKCPIKQMREKLLKGEVLTESQIDDLEIKILKEINEAFTFAKESPYPHFDLDYERIYAE